MRKISHIRAPRGHAFDLCLQTKIILFLHKQEFMDQFI